MGGKTRNFKKKAGKGQGSFSLVGFRGVGFWTCCHFCPEDFGVANSPQNQAGELSRNYRASTWHYRQRKLYFKIVWHFVADTDTII